MHHNRGGPSLDAWLCTPRARALLYPAELHRAALRRALPRLPRLRQSVFHAHMPAQVLLIQCAIFRELVNVRYRRRLEDIPYFRTSQWGWFYAAILMTYGQRLQSPARLKLIHSPMVRACLPYVDGVAVLIYSALLVGTVLTLQKGKYRYQIGQLAWTVSIVVVAVVQVAYRA